MKRLEDMSLEELWALFPIVLAAPDPHWPEQAADEISCLHKSLGLPLSAFSHIGSTAIKDIMAKPIIDILIEAECKSDFKSLKHKIMGVGYLCMNETDTRIDFNKGYTPTGFADRVFHLHLRLPGDNDEIYFRDYLNTHHNIAKAYEKLKLSLWKRFEHDRDGYTNAKNDFIQRYTEIAKQSD